MGHVGPARKRTNNEKIQGTNEIWTIMERGKGELKRKNLAYMNRYVFREGGVTPLEEGMMLESFNFPSLF